MRFIWICCTLSVLLDFCSGSFDCMDILVAFVFTFVPATAYVDCIDGISVIFISVFVCDYHLLGLLLKKCKFLSIAKGSLARKPFIYFCKSIYWLASHKILRRRSTGLFGE